MSVKVVHKNSKVNYYGIEVDPEITWKGWEPGKKYTKKLVLKNVKFSTQKLNFCVPSKEVFTTTFPKTITLSAGTSFQLPITFKPHRKDVFIDKIDFQNNEGEIFSVPVKALLPQYAVELPDKLSCGTVAAHDVVERQITVTNISELETPFRWCDESPYSIEPQSGTFEPFQTVNFTVAFRPQDVGTYTMIIPFLYGNKLMFQKSLTVTSVAKYPNISIMIEDLNQVETLNSDGQLQMDFDVGSVGKMYERMLHVQNVSEVDASVEIIRADDTNPIDWAIFPSYEFSKVPGRSYVTVVFQFQPKLSLTRYVENFLLRISNKCGTYLLKCVADTDGPLVTVSQKSINFFQLNMGESAKQPIWLYNNNQLSATNYQFIIDSNYSVFQIDYPSGFIKAGDHIQIVVSFHPQQPIQYYRRLICLVPDQEPIFIDVLGTCHDMHSRPQILQIKHLIQFQKRQLLGLSYLPAENLMRYQATKDISLTESGDIQIEKEDELKDVIEVVPELTAWKEYFFTNMDIDITYFTPYIGQDTHSVYFNNVEYVTRAQIKEKLLLGILDSSETESINLFKEKVNLKNNTQGSIIVQWSENQNPEKQFFSVQPSKAELSPGETFEFSVLFQPNGSDKLFDAELEGFAYYKSQRQFELVDQVLISPPFCIVLKCVGQTFIKSKEPFLPRFNFDRMEVVFPSVNTGEMAFRSLTLTNKSQQPMIFDCKQLKEPFAIKPDIGLIPPNCDQIFTINCEPKSISKYEDIINIMLNNRNDYKLTIPILGSADNALVVLENKSEIFFGPTNIGNLSSQKYPVKNTSRIPVKFTWKIKPDDSFTIRVYPESGMILPNEIITQEWIFSPKTVGRKVIKTLLMVQGISPFGSLTEPKYYSLRIIGNGEETFLEINENELNFEPQIVGSSAQKTFEIYNPTEATVYYKFFVVQQENLNDIEDKKLKDEIENDLRCIEINDIQGDLPGRSRKLVFVSVRPRLRKSYKFQIGYVLVDNDSLELDIVSANDNGNNQTSRIFKKEYEFLEVKMRGVFPTLRVTDVQASGSSVWISKINLWKNLSLDNLNVCLDSDPTTSELIYNVATRASFHRPTPVSTRAIININMGASPVSSEASEVRLLLENCGSVPTNFAFLFPQDSELELEYWAETGEYTDEELHQMKVQDNLLFDIQPRKSIVRPGESVTVLIQYFHKVVGTDRLPIIFKLDRGREILINMVGVTLDLERCYIHFPSKCHVFQPTPIGLYRAPVQYYEMHNAGAVPIHYELDLEPALTELMQKNFNIALLQCLNPIGDIYPGQTCRLEWLFNPIEAKTYTIEVPIHFSSGDCPRLQFTAIGYDPRDLGDTFNPLTSTPGQCGVPSQQSITLPNQLAKLNYERLNIGSVPTFTTIRRVVFLTNTTANQSITFSWNVTNSDDSEYIYLSPQCGRILANETISCHVIIQTRNVPRFFDVNLICEIYNEEEILQFKHELLAWEKEEGRRTVEFTISDKKKSLNTQSRRTTNNDESDQSRKSSSMSLLPPVLQSPSKSRVFSNQKSSSNISELKRKDLWYKPQMPKAFFLNFGISGRSCPIDEFQLDHAEELKQFSINKLAMMENLNSPQNVLGTTSPLEGHKQEMYLLDTVLSDLLGNILKDGDFRETIRDMNKEPIPYYIQFPRALAINSNEETSTLTANSVEGDEKHEVENEEEEKELEHEEGKQEISKDTEDVKATKLTEQKRVSPDMIECGSSCFEEPEEGNDKVILESLAFGTIVENIMENMIFNIISEANNREVDLTARPRFISLPPRSGIKQNTAQIDGTNPN